MFRNAEEATALLDRHDAIEVRVAHKTFISRVTDTVAALRYRTDFLAWYGANGVVLSAKNLSPTARKRLTEFTPAEITVGCHKLLPYANSVLYSEGMKFAADGYPVNGIMPTKQQAIEWDIRQVLDRVDSWVAMAVTCWDAFHPGSHDWDHNLQHTILNNVVPTVTAFGMLDDIAASPDEQRERARRMLTRFVYDQLRRNLPTEVCRKHGHEYTPMRRRP